MKYLLAFLLWGLSLPLGIMAALNIYFIFATMGSSQIPAPTMAKYAMTSALALFAVVFFVGGFAVLAHDRKS
jgi:hypothetical protein